MLSLPATAITAFYSSFAWLDRRVFWLAARELASSIVFFAVLFIFIGHLHLLAVGIASLVSSGLQGIFFLPIAIRRYRQTSDFDAVELTAEPPSPATP